MAEKRYIHRQRRRFALRFGQEEAIRLGFTEDISMEGMFIRTTHIYPPGTEVKVTLTLPDDVSVRIVGRVMWAKRVPPQMVRLVKKAGFGIKIESFVEGEAVYRLACEKTLTKA